MESRTIAAALAPVASLSRLAKVPNGILPAIELDGRVYTESLDIMALLDASFSPASDEDGGGGRYRAMVPPRGSPELERAQVWRGAAASRARAHNHQQDGGSRDGGVREPTVRRPRGPCLAPRRSPD